MRGTRDGFVRSFSHCFPVVSALVLVTLLVHGSAKAIESGGSKDDPYRCCGLNCLTIIARLHDIDVPHKTIETLLKPRLNGDCSVADIERAATSLGLRPVSVRTEWNRLPDLQTPCIVQVRSPTRYATGSHFLLVMGLHREGVILLDPPALGQIHPYEEFQGEWTGITILFAQDEAEKDRLVSLWRSSVLPIASVGVIFAIVAVIGFSFVLARAGNRADSSVTSSYQHPGPAGS